MSANYMNMSAYYDIIMTSGYYDYEKIVDNLISYSPIKNILEIGCGTGLILEKLVKKQPQNLILGVDFSSSMLKIAQKRLQPFPNVFLSFQNVIHLALKEQYSLAFSYGGCLVFCC